MIQNVTGNKNVGHDWKLKHESDNDWLTRLFY